MRARIRSLTPIAILAIVLVQSAHTTPRAQAQSAAALTGQVTSSEEGPMEGVLVSARKAGSTLTTTVVSDGEGRYRFPAARLEPGQYALHIRAIGYDLENDAAVSVAVLFLTDDIAPAINAWSRVVAKLPAGQPSAHDCLLSGASMPQRR